MQLPNNKEVIKLDNGEKLLAIFEAYNLCDAREIGQLVRQEMLVALGKQDDIDWDCIIDGGLAHAKERYQNVHNMVKKTMYKGHKYQEALEP